MEMNKNRILISFALIGAFLFLTSQTTNEPILTKQKDITIINTTSLATDIEGYVAQTPVKVYIQGDKVLRIEADRKSVV